MNATATERVTALQILKETRDLFAATHWTSGALYNVDEKGKKKFCMVGGLCHTFAKNDLPEWLEANHKDEHEKEILSFYAGELEDDYYVNQINLDVDLDFLSELIKAEYEFAKTVNASAVKALGKDWHPGSIENIIIQWNDGIADSEFRTRGDASFVIKKMDKTIERLEKEQS